MFGTSRRRRRPGRDRHPEDDFFDPVIEALVPGRESGYFGFENVGENFGGPESYPDPVTGGPNPGNHHNFRPPNSGLGTNASSNFSRAWGAMNNNRFEVWNNGELVASSGSPPSGRRTQCPGGGGDIYLGGGPQGGSRGRRPGRRSHPSGHGGGRMPGGFQDFFGSDFEGIPADILRDLDFPDFFGGHGGRGRGAGHGGGSRGEDPFSGRRGPGDTRISRQGGESDEDDDEGGLALDGDTGYHQARGRGRRSRRGGHGFPFGNGWLQIHD